MRRKVISLFLALVVVCLVLSCKAEVLKDGENINSLLYPYLEFTLSEDGSYYTAEVIENVRLERVEIPEAVDNLGLSIPVLYFNGFKNADDAANLRNVVLATSNTVIKEDALKKAGSLFRLDVKKVDEETTLPELPIIEREDKEFIGWFIPGTETKVSSGDSISLSSLSIEPRWKDHSLVLHERKEATCTEDGWTEYYTCKTCSYNTKKIIPKLGHKLLHHEEIKATCTESGTRDYYECSRCRKYFSDSKFQNEIDEIALPKLNHKLYKVDELAPTCTLDGNKEYYKCEYCSRIFSDSSASKELEDITLKSSGHKWEQKANWKECSVCHETKDYSGEIRHTLQKVEEKRATCLSNGNKTYYRCSDCNLLFLDKNAINQTTEDSVVIAKLGHVRGSVYYHDATHHWFKCVRCNEVLEKKSHSYSLEDTNTLTLISSANCEHGAIYYKSCACGALDSETFISGEALGHDLKKIERKEATCTSDGNIEYYKCSRCNRCFENSDASKEIKESDTILNKTGKHIASGKYENVGESGHKEVCSLCHRTFGDTIAHKINKHSGFDSINHWDSCSYCDYKGHIENHNFIKIGSDDVCSICLYSKEKQETTDGGFDIKPETREPRGQITVIKEDGRYKASFTLDKDSHMTRIEWYLDDVKVSTENECFLSLLEERSYCVMCVVFNENLVNSYSTIVIGSSNS